MTFKDWLKIQENVAVKPPFLNKHMYDMSSDKGRQEYERDLADLQQMMASRNKRQVVSQKEISEPIVITCWRGFDERSLTRDTVSITQNGRVLSGNKAMEGILWFTHDKQRSNFDPKEYALHHAEDYLLTYPLQATKHYQATQYSDGTVENSIPERFANEIQSSSESQITAMDGVVYELPKGWSFTWQVQKHIGCRIPIKITNDMLQNVKQ